VLGKNGEGDDKMRVVLDDSTADEYVILLNGRPVITAVEADDKESWVDILDPAAMAPLDLDEHTHLDTDMPEFKEIKTRRLFGKVEIRRR
jgi:hypothetical protein